MKNKTITLGLLYFTTTVFITQAQTVAPTTKTNQPPQKTINKNITKAATPAPTAIKPTPKTPASNVAKLNTQTTTAAKQPSNPAAASKLTTKENITKSAASKNKPKKSAAPTQLNKRNNSSTPKTSTSQLRSRSATAKRETTTQNKTLNVAIQPTEITVETIPGDFHKTCNCYYSSWEGGGALTCDCAPYALDYDPKTCKYVRNCSGTLTCTAGIGGDTPDANTKECAQVAADLAATTQNIPGDFHKTCKKCAYDKGTNTLSCDDCGGGNTGYANNKYTTLVYNQQSCKYVRACKGVLTCTAGIGGDTPEANSKDCAQIEEQAKEQIVAAQKLPGNFQKMCGSCTLANNTLQCANCSGALHVPKDCPFIQNCDGQLSCTPGPKPGQKGDQKTYDAQCQVIHDTLKKKKKHRKFPTGYYASY